jgi:hypothetical protein
MEKNIYISILFMWKSSNELWKPKLNMVKNSMGKYVIK